MSKVSEILASARELLGFQPPQQRLKLSIQFYVEADGEAFHAFSPALPGLHVDGETQDEAALNFSAEVPAYLESLAKHGEPLPICTVQVLPPYEPKATFMRQVQVAWPSLQMSGIS